MPQSYAPPPGPPPSHSQNQNQTSQSPYDYAPPAGPPPSSSKNNPFFNSPSSNAPEYAPPTGPPPSHGAAQKQHDWESAVPDTSLLPPPPNFFSGFDRSPANNATEEEAEAGERWCASYPLYPPMPFSAEAADAARVGNVALYAPPHFKGTLTQKGMGVWSVVSGSRNGGAPDTCLATYPPLYHAAAHSPAATGAKGGKTVYYEVRILADGNEKEVPLALGFTAPPYPAFRLPGWHRGSLGVHGDDGHKYINDRWGGKEFTAPFRRGETVGLGMRFHYSRGRQAVEIFLTRNGAEAGRWDLHEETDQEQDLPVTGLEGHHDLCAAVGCFERVAFEVVFRPDAWVWRGYEG